MDLSDRQRRLAFAGLAVALAAVGVYLTLPGRAAPSEDPGAGAASPRVSGSAPAHANASANASPPGPAPSNAASPTPEPSGFDIYPLLPFGEKDFAAAADVAIRFTIAHGTYRFDEDPKVYLSRLEPLMTPDLRAEIERGAASPGLIEQRKQEQVIATGEATINAIRDIEKSSITFLVTGKQRVTKSGQPSESSERYSVTVSKDGGRWKVYAFQPADVGQAGDTG